MKFSYKKYNFIRKLNTLVFLCISLQMFVFVYGENCSEGQYRNTDDASCIDCLSGLFSKTINATACTTCQKGKYQPDSGRSNCINCASGKYNEEVGARSSSDCKDCTSGKYNQKDGATSCNDCQKGKYQPDSGRSNCINCASGKYNEEGNSIVMSAIVGFFVMPSVAFLSL